MARDRNDYRHRPAKNIERHIIVDAARQLLVAHGDVDFQYIGFGALEFIDFDLMHRALNISDMTSIESSQNTDRFEFNKPFDSIKIVNQHSNAAFGNGAVKVNRPSIIWLDYTDLLSAAVMQDISVITRLIAEPSFLIITVNAHPPMPKEERIKELEKKLGAKHLPAGLDPDLLGGDGLAILQRRLLTSHIEQALRRNRARVKWNQVVNIHYQDDARMQTLGGFILPENVTDEAVAAMFNRHDFYRPGDVPLSLRVPVITTRERAVLDRQLPAPSATLTIPEIPDMPAEDLEDYKGIYRYLHLAGLQSAPQVTWAT